MLELSPGETNPCREQCQITELSDGIGAGNRGRHSLGDKPGPEKMTVDALRQAQLLWKASTATVSQPLQEETSSGLAPLGLASALQASQPCFCPGADSCWQSRLGPLAFRFQGEFGHRRRWQEIRGKEESEIRMFIMPPSTVMLAPPPQVPVGWPAPMDTPLSRCINKAPSPPLVPSGLWGVTPFHCCDPQGASPFLPHLCEYSLH